MSWMCPQEKYTRIEHKKKIKIYNTLGSKRNKTKREKKWRNLCTVVPRTIKKMNIYTKEIGNVEVDQATLRCLTKIFGLIQPHTWDSVIWTQIPNL